MTNINDAQTQGNPASPEPEFDEKASGFGFFEEPAKAAPPQVNPPAQSAAPTQHAGPAPSKDHSEGVSFDDYGLKDPFAEAELAGDLNYIQPSTLSAPPARPGFVQRFVRFSEGGKTDEKNVAMKTQRQFWRPRKFAKSDSYGYAFSKVRDSEDYVIMINGHVLCERPVATNDRFRDMYQQANNRMTDAEKQQYKQQGEEAGVGVHAPRVQFDTSSQVSRGFRPTPPVAPNRNKT